MSKWKKVIFASDCKECQMCGDPVCPVCDNHYAECECPRPTQDDLYDYKDFNGVLMARLLEYK